MHKYTEAEREFMAEYVPGHSHKEIQEAFTEKFGWEIKRTQVAAYIKNHNLNTGRTGRFEKGQKAHNKGQKMSPEVYEKTKRTMFKKGNMPVNHRPVGSERITRDGYIEVKVAEPNKWKLKHRYAWENENGKIPNGHVILFLDGNKLNVDISNMKLIKRSELLIMARYDLYGDDAQTTDTATNLARLIATTNEIKRERRNEQRKDFEKT